MLNKKLLFLGGTCSGEDWRIPFTKELDRLNIFWYNPLVKDWSARHKVIEETVKRGRSALNMFHITGDIEGVYSIAELVREVYQNIPNYNMPIFSYNPKGMTPKLVNSLEAISDMVYKKAHVLFGDPVENIGIISDIYFGETPNL